MLLASWKVRAGVPVALLLACACTPALRAQDGTGNPPVIISLNTAQVPGQKFQISGTVADNNPSACSVTISGAASGTLQCDASGNFSGVFAVPTLGQITAVATDGTQNSQPAVATLGNNAPTITVTAIYHAGMWIFSGTVGDEAPAGLTVTLSGSRLVNGQQATVQADGTWRIALTAGSAASGSISAKVTDWYGQQATAYTSY
jgi:hypothetical protein